MKPRDEYIPLLPLLEGYWDKPLSKLPKVLRARVGTKVVKRLVGHKPKFDANGEFVHDAEGQYPVWRKVYSEHEVGDFIISWDALTADMRKACARQIDGRHDPANKKEEQYYFDLVSKKYAIENEIRKWELMHSQGIPSEEQIKQENLDELRAKLAEIKRQLELPPPDAPAAKGKDVPDTSQGDIEIPGKMPRTTIGNLAIKAAWQIECKTGKRATAKRVIEKLQSWVDHKDNPQAVAELTDKIANGVKWVTRAGKGNNYDIGACQKTLETWNKSRA